MKPKSAIAFVFNQAQKPPTSDSETEATIPPSLAILITKPAATNPMSIKRILLIDDEGNIHKIAQVELLLGAGWELLTAQSSDEGLAIATSETLDAILLDVMMPERDGVATLKLLQSSPVTHNIPVIFVTAKAQSSDRRRFYALGAQGVITKPFDPMTLASQIAGFWGW